MKKSKVSSWFLLSVLACFLVLSASLLSTSWSSQIVTLQPGPGSNDGTDDGSGNKGKDAGFDLSQWTTGPNDGDGDLLKLFNSDCNALGIWPGFLSFSLNGMPKQNISKAEIQVYTQVYFNGAGSPWSIDPIISAYRLTQSWTEMTVAKNFQPTYNLTVLDSHTIDTVGGSGTPYIEFQDWLSFDITDLYKGWADGSVTNYGITFRIDNASCPNGDLFDIFSSDYLTDPTLRPKLVVTAECASPPSDMISWWSGDGHPFDLIDDNDGTLMGNATYAQGLVGKAFSFDGDSDYVEFVGANKALNAPIQALTNTALGNPVNAVDGNLGTVWYSFQGTQSYIQFVVDLGTEIPIGKIVFQALQTDSYAIETSSNGVDWTPRHNGLLNYFLAPLTTIDAQGAYTARYIRYYGYNNQNGYVGISELEVYAGSGIDDFGNNPFTADFWMYSNNVGNGAYLMGKSHPDGGLGWDIRLNNSTIQVAGVNGWSFNITSDASATQNTWHHIAVSSTDTNVYLYIDGVQKGSCSRVAITSTTNPFRIGYTTDFGGSAFNGLIDEVEIFDRALTQTEIQDIYNAGAAGKCKPCLTPPTGMVSWWTGDNTANDIIDSNHGTLMNGATFAPGKVGETFSFDGVDDYVQVPHSPALDITGAITMDAWIKINAADDGVILIKGDPGCFVGSCSYGMALDPDGSVFMIMYSSGTELCRSDPGIISPNQWYHVAATWDGTTVNPNNVTLYVNGTIAKSCTKTTALNSNSETLIIGSHGSSLLRQFNGLIDEVEIFNRALSAEEIAAIYAAGSAGKCVPSDTTPDPFSFTDQTNVALNSVITSDTITVSGIDSPADISITNCTSTSCEYSIDGGATWTSNDGTVNNGDNVQVRQTSSPNYSTTTDLTLDIGGVSDTFSVTTIAPPTGTRSISGRVKTPGDIPIAGVTITLSGDASGSTTTNTFGRYRFNGLGNGNYTITPGMAGYIFTPASRTAVISGANVAGRNFTATPGSAPYFISGVVRTSSGTPIEGVTMKLDGDAVVWITTDNRGKYIFTGLANGNYIVTPVKKGYNFTPVSRTIAISGAGVAGRNFTGNP